jgi:hypothetical protein
MEGPRVLLYIGTILIILSIFWTVIVECNQGVVTAELIRKGLPTPAYADAFQLQSINKLQK